MAAMATLMSTVVVGVFGSAQAKKSAMATKGKKSRARWDSDTESKLIDVWADILGEFSGIMMPRKKKEALA